LLKLPSISTFVFVTYSSLNFLTMFYFPYKIVVMWCDWNVTGSSFGNNLLCKKQGKAAYITPIGGTPSQILHTQEL